ncbi:MAG: FAD-dependent oxidoreductase [Eubacterium sp.]|nr:FAD-dependent oxidoreductase [Eubacterium sp.]
MLRFTNCKLSYKDQSIPYIKKQVAKELRCNPEELKQFRIEKKSFDARKKPDVYIIYSVLFDVDNEAAFYKKHRSCKKLEIAAKNPDLREHISPIKTDKKIIVVGAGPAGLFCAYYLALCGASPIVIERGEAMEQRRATVEHFWQSGELDEHSNVSFGEGGAGTFSDGKLNTGVKDKTGRKQFVLQSFVEFGAQENICYDNKPHIGTDVLRDVIVNMREKMKELGCEFRFCTQLIDIQQVNAGVTGAVVKTPDGELETIPCGKIILAPGHSARDTFRMLYEKNVAMEQKAFAMGVRIQHKQADIDFAQYGVSTPLLPPSPYKCTGKAKDGRGVYSFCMCPGGYVVNASSENNGTVVNGMSHQKRDSGYANSAIIVTVNESDFGSGDVFAGVEFQRKLEQAMYELGSGMIPVQTYGNFNGSRNVNELGEIAPCVKGKWKLCAVDKTLPKFMKSAIIDGIEMFSKKIRGFNNQDALIMGVESRTSSPVRIVRDEDFTSISMQGLYPCGEGAGYAGGIMSAAMDGLRVAMKIQEELKDRNE